MTATTKQPGKAKAPVQRRVWKGAGMYTWWVESGTTTLDAYKVEKVWTDDWVCRGNQDGEKCWPYSRHMGCPHTRAIEEFLAQAQAPAAKVLHRVRLEDLFAA